MDKETVIKKHGRIYSLDDFVGGSFPSGSVIADMFYSSDGYSLFFINKKPYDVEGEDYDMNIDGTQINSLFYYGYSAAEEIQQHILSNDCDVYVSDSFMEEIDCYMIWQEIYNEL